MAPADSYAGMAAGRVPDHTLDRRDMADTVGTERILDRTAEPPDSRQGCLDMAGREDGQDNWSVIARLAGRESASQADVALVVEQSAVPALVVVAGKPEPGPREDTQAGKDRRAADS